MNKEILNMEEAAELFGVSVKTFIKLLKEEKVPARKIGREWRFSRKALIDWLSSGDSQAYSSSEAEVRDFFDKVAPEWEKIREGYYDESIKSKIFEMGILDKSFTVMDIGCGDGYISRAVARSVRKVIAVDISREMLRELEKKAKESGIENIRTVESDGQDIPVDDDSIDIIFASMYLHHIEEPDIAVKEISRLLKPGGIAFLADFHEHNNMELKEKMHDLWPGFKTETIKKLFRKNGFKIIHVETLDNDVIKRGQKPMEKIFVLTAVKEKNR